ncbi:hypothetical protein KIN20_004413, partial [Parelaphostrongylus tenuis]
LSKKNGKLVFLGLDNAGKTTLLAHVEGRQNGTTCANFTSNFRRINSRRYPIYHLRSWWTRTSTSCLERLFPCVDAIVFLVDCADLERIAESRSELESLIRDEQVAGAPILILGNKIDKSTALSEEQLKWHLGIQHMCTGKGEVSRNDLSSRPMEVFMCSVLRRQGYGEGFRWLSQYLD